MTVQLRDPLKLRVQLTLSLLLNDGSTERSPQIEGSTDPAPSLLSSCALAIFKQIQITSVYIKLCLLISLVATTSIFDHQTTWNPSDHRGSLKVLRFADI